MPNIISFFLLILLTAGILAVFSLQTSAEPPCESAVEGTLVAMQDIRVGDPDTGASIYEENCAKCHGSGGTGGFAPSHVGCDICNDYPALVMKIEDDMPKGDAGSCIGDCASDTAAFIYAGLNGNSF